MRWLHSFFCYGDEENGMYLYKCHLTTANQSEIRKAYLVSVVAQQQSNKKLRTAQRFCEK